MSLFGDHLYQFGKERYLNIGDTYLGYSVLDVKKRFKILSYILLSLKIDDLFCRPKKVFRI